MSYLITAAEKVENTLKIFGTSFCQALIKKYHNIEGARNRLRCMSNVIEWKLILGRFFGCAMQ